MQLGKGQAENPSKLNVDRGEKSHWFRLLLEYSFQGHYEKINL